MDLPFSEFAEKHLKVPKSSNSALICWLAALEPFAEYALTLNK